MSTLLERMIQRTRGPLSSLEPVARPAFAAVPLGGQGWTDPVGRTRPSDEAIVDEASMAASRLEPHPGGHLDQPSGGRPGQRAGARLEGPRVVGGDHADDLAGSGPEPVSGWSARPAPAMPTPMMPGRPSRIRSTSRGQLATANPHPDEDHREPGPDPVAAPGGQAGEEPHDARERGIRQMHAVPVTRPANAAAAVSAEAALAGPAEAAVAGIEAAAEEPGTAAPAAVAVVEPGPVQARLLPAHPPGQRPAPPGQAADVFPGSGPEVTISIGHIEVHSAPAEEKPRIRPPFRPQVSLADFLGQDRRP